MLKISLVVLVVIILVAGGLWLNWQIRTPSHDRDWQPLYATLPEVEQRDSVYTVKNVRNWSYGPDRSTSEDWLDVTLDPSDVVHVYFIVEPFGSMKAVAHTMLAFEFADGSGYVASVEARRAVGQSYGGLKAGVLPMHEYMFIWATERDMYGNNTFFTGDTLYSFRLKLSDAAKRAVLVAMLEETATLQDNPQFYNTFFSNCTNVLARAVNKVSPNAVPWHYSWHMPGLVPEYLIKRGLIEAPAGYDAVRTKGYIAPQHVEAVYQTEDPTAFAQSLRARLWD